MVDKANRQDTLNYKVEPKDSFGASLRRERELRSIPLEDVAKATNIQLIYLQALEEDDYDKLPHSTFVRGFIRSYARYIGLNPDNAIANHDHFLSTLAKETEEKPIEYQNKKNTWLLTTVISCTLVILALLGYYLVVYMRVFEDPNALTTETQQTSPSNLGTQLRDLGSISESVDREVNSKVQQALPSTSPSKPGIQQGSPKSINESADREGNSKVQQALPATSPSKPGIQQGSPESINESADGGAKPEIQPVSSSNPAVQPEDAELTKEPIDRKDSSKVMPRDHKENNEAKDKKGVPLPPTSGPDHQSRVQPE